MNAQDIALVLDDEGFDALDAGARKSAVARLESFTDCRSEWELQARLIARSVPPMPANLVAHCRALVASGPQARRSQRARSGLILIGTVAVVAAAAVMLVAALWPAADETEQFMRSAGTSSVQLRAGEVPARDAATDLEEGIEAPSGPAFLVYVRPLADPDSRTPTALADAYGPVVREQLRARDADPARRNAMASFRAALISELALVPGLGLVESEMQLSGVTQSTPGYRLTVGGLTMFSASNQLVDPGLRYVDVSVTPERVRPGGETTIEQRAVVRTRIDQQGECRTSATGEISCTDVNSQAASAVRQLREQLFPPDPSITRQRQVRLLNTALEPAQRYSALEELLGIQRGGAAQAAALRDPATLRGLLDFAATADPALRARIWRAIRGVGEPDLLQPLQAAAVSDADEPRLEAVATLAADFAQDPRGRATLESVANTDRRALVRAVAERGLSGEATWRTYVNASLQDAGLPAAERVEAIAYQFNLPTHQQPQGTGQTFAAFSMLDEAGVDVLARLMPEASNERPASEGTMVRIANALAPRYRSSPAVTDALLHYLQQGKSANTRMIAVQVLGFTQKNEERVRSAMREALRSDPDSQVRDLVREMMGEGFADTPP